MENFTYIFGVSQEGNSWPAVPRYAVVSLSRCPVFIAPDLPGFAFSSLLVFLVNHSPPTLEIRREQTSPTARPVAPDSARLPLHGWLSQSARETAVGSVFLADGVPQESAPASCAALASATPRPFSGFDGSERTISHWTRRVPRSPEPAKLGLSFLRNHREAMAAMDFFRSNPDESHLRRNWLVF